MKNFLLGLIPTLTTKTAVTAAVCVVSGAAVTATATGVIYTHKTAQYRETIERLETAQEEKGNAGGGATYGDAGEGADTAVRVVDGILEVWDGSQWIDYGPVDDVEASDPYYENDDRKQETERSVAEKKLAQLGLTINEKGEITAADPSLQNTVPAQNKAGVLVGNKTSAAGTNAVAANDKKNTKTANARDNKNDGTSTDTRQAEAAGGTTAEQVMAAIQAGVQSGTKTVTQTISSIPQTSSPSAGVTTSSWTASPSSGGEDPYGDDHHDSDSDSGSSSGSGESSGGGESSSDSGGGSSSGSGGGGGGGGGGSSHEESSSSGTNDSGSSNSNNNETASGSEGDGFSEDYL